MEEIEVPTEHLHEQMHEEAHHSSERWISRVALSSAMLAVFAAIAALMAGHHANEAMIDQIKASNQWNYYQAKGIKAAVLGSRIELLREMRQGNAESAADKSKDEAKLEKYGEEQKEIQEQAREFEETSEHHLVTHQILARSVTMFQVAIALAAITVLMRRKPLWFVSLGFGVIGLGFLIQGMIQAAGHG